MPLTSLGLRGGGFLFSMEIVFKPEELIGKISQIEKVLLPRASFQALHRAVFRTTREILPDRVKPPGIFKQANRFTLNSFLYDRPSAFSDHLKSRIYIRDDAPKGNAPADYLSPQIVGGNAYRTRFQRRLERKGFLGGAQDAYMMPALKSINRSGLAKGEYTRALWAISAMNDLRGNYDYEARAYKSQGKYVWVPPNLSEQVGAEAHARLVRSLNKGRIPKAGIYKVLKSGLKQRFISLPYIPQNAPKFNFTDIAADSVRNVFSEELIKNLRRI